MLASPDVAELLGNVVIGLLFAVACAVIAASRGRSAVGWFFLGLFLSCIALVLVLVLPDLKQQEERQERQNLENRRLREQLAKERQVADQRHGNVARRLGVHDQALGVDTADAPAIAEPTGAPPALPHAPTWFYARGKERMGPVAIETIRHLLHARAIDANTLVWREGMADWAALGAVEEFRGDLA